jgi:hypothetical protein
MRGHRAPALPETAEGCEVKRFLSTLLEWLTLAALSLAIGCAFALAV